MLSNDVNIVISGEAGQGIDLVSNILMRILKSCNFNVFCSLEYMSRIRGGCNAAFIRVADCEIACPRSPIDILIALDVKVLDYFKTRISEDTILIFNKKFDASSANCKTKIELDFVALSKVVNGVALDTIVSAGFVLGLMGVGLENATKILQEIFTSEDDLQKNIASIDIGYSEGSDYSARHDIKIEIQQDDSLEDKILISGNDALGIGFIAGGCNFISYYPMTPGSALFTFIAQEGEQFSIITDQAEDEIAAVNMALGAWYAGARALVTTAGGGFSLMGEGISLAGMIESPLVMHVAQRPGPATGLPTRTEQGDLELVLYAGAGEFPKIILAPTTPIDAFELGQKAFDLADKFQVPVFILTDQYFIDSKFISGVFDCGKCINKYHFVKSDENYKRYAVSQSSHISPRAIPSYGSGLVCVDSDEHTEEGIIVEDPMIRKTMVDKRLGKFDEISTELVPLEFIGSKDYKTLVIGWGSTYSVIKEVISKLPDTAFLCLKQLYPLHPDIKGYIIDSDELVIVENNATSQLSKLLKANFNCGFRHKILKYDGFPFTVEELLSKLEEVINEDVQ